MNIFHSHSDPILAAHNLDNKRVVKMLLESVQMLSTAINLNGGKAHYKTTHANHPSNVWTRQTRTNWFWLYSHALELSSEYTLRYNKTHKCHKILLELLCLSGSIPDGQLTPFANCAAHNGKGISYKDNPNTIEAYRQYLVARWNTDILVPKWGIREKPNWLGVDSQGKYCYTPIND